jgi:DNA-binding SARP family transcriptional activator
VEFRILGPLEVVEGDDPVEIAGTKRRTLLALLLLHANEVVRTERLIDELWGEQTPHDAAGALHNHVSRLRKALGPETLARKEWGYVLRAEPEAIDLRRFERLLREAEPLPARERGEALREALALWRGPALADLVQEPALQAEIGRLEELRLVTLERRIDADLEAGRNAELIGEIEALIGRCPMREHLRGQLILALYRAGRQAEALEVYRETRRVLSDELGLEPSPALKDLERAILRQDPEIATVVPPATAPAAEIVAWPSWRRGAFLGALALALLAFGGGLAFALTRPAKHHPAPLTSVAAGTSTATSVPVVVHTRKRPAHRVVTRRARHKKLHTVAHPLAPLSTTLTGTRTVTTTSASTTTTRRVTTKPRIVTISDHFSADQIDGTIWDQWMLGSGWTLSEHDGHLEFTFPPGTAPGGQWNNYSGGVGTLCRFPGQFDARVDFTLAQWPPANLLYIALQVFFQPNNRWAAGAFRQSTPQGGETYGGWVSDGSNGGAALNDMSGTLRVARKNGIVTTYFLHNHHWISLGSGRDTRLAIVTVMGQSATTNPPVRTNLVVADFTNFTVTAANPICPPGAQGSTR